MRILLVLLLTLAPVSWAQNSLSKETFQAQVRPGLNAIINDFYQMITLFPDFPKEMVNVVELLETLSIEKENLLLSCPRTLNIKCLPPIDAIKETLINVEARTLALLSTQMPSASLYLTSIGGMRLMNEFQGDLYALRGALSNASFLIRAQIQDQKNTLAMVKEIDELRTLIALAVVEFIPFIYREDFRQFFFNFIHPIEANVSKSRNYEFLNRNVNSLNFALNLLNMNLTKRNKKTPEGMAPYLSLIHNRWNGLLRYYMLK